MKYTVGEKVSLSQGTRIFVSGDILPDEFIKEIGSNLESHLKHGSILELKSEPKPEIKSEPKPEIKSEPSKGIKSSFGKKDEESDI
jgi:hypothetical protein